MLFQASRGILFIVTCNLLVWLFLCNGTQTVKVCMLRSFILYE